MAVLDSQGRLFGKISILDLAALVIILGVVFGIFLFPGSSGSVAQLGTTVKPVEVDVVVKGLNAKNPDQLIADMLKSAKTSIIIRNQPYGQVGIKAIEKLPRNLVIPQPDGTGKSLPDIRPELAFTADMIITLTGKAQITENGPVFGNNKVKIGTVLELEGYNYDFNASVIDVRIPEQS